jgi:hypothetical protein
LKFFFEEFCPPVGLLRRKTETVAVHWTSTSVPEFADILRCIAEHIAASKNRINCGSYQGIIAMVRLHPPEKDVAIDEVRRPCHLDGPHRNFRA